MHITRSITTNVRVDVELAVEDWLSEYVELSTSKASGACPKTTAKHES